jgi:hypothetical protein
MTVHGTCNWHTAGTFDQGWIADAGVLLLARLVLLVLVLIAGRSAVRLVDVGRYWSALLSA